MHPFKVLFSMTSLSRRDIFLLYSAVIFLIFISVLMTSPLRPYVLAHELGTPPSLFCCYWKVITLALCYYWCDIFYYVHRQRAIGQWNRRPETEQMEPHTVAAINISGMAPKCFICIYQCLVLAILYGHYYWPTYTDGWYRYLHLFVTSIDFCSGQTQYIVCWSIWSHH